MCRLERRAEHRSLPESLSTNIKSPDEISHGSHKQNVVSVSVGHFKIRHIQRLSFNARVILKIAVDKVETVHPREAFAAHKGRSESRLGEICSGPAVVVGTGKNSSCHDAYSFTEGDSLGPADWCARSCRTS